MRIFLTGATGFIGSHVLSQALTLGYDVTAVTRSEKQILNENRSGVKWLHKSFSDVTASTIADCDVLIHLAAHSVQHPLDTIANCIHWNLTSPLSLFEQARHAGIRRFIIIGSCFEYGRSGLLYETIPTSAPLDPMDSYSSSKAAASIVFRNWADEHNLSLELLRLFQVYGEGESKNRLWPSLRKAALSGESFSMTLGEQIRDFIEVEKVAQTILSRALISSKQGPTSRIFNVGSGKAQTLREFAEYWWSHWNATGELRLGVLPYRGTEIKRYVAGPDLLLVD
jgi:nucleoside-diphosphate-sugar epimerase